MTGPSPTPSWPLWPATLEAQLDRIGAPSDGPIAVSCEDYLDYAATFVALLAAGRTVVPLDPRAPAPELRRTRALTGTVATITRTDLFEGGRGPEGGIFVDMPEGGSGRFSGTRGNWADASLVLVADRVMLVRALSS